VVVGLTAMVIVAMFVGRRIHAGEPGDLVEDAGDAPDPEVTPDELAPGGAPGARPPRAPPPDAGP
jgi:hypothetical protein